MKVLTCPLAHWTALTKVESEFLPNWHKALVLKSPLARSSRHAAYLLHVWDAVKVKRLLRSGYRVGHAGRSIHLYLLKMWRWHILFPRLHHAYIVWDNPLRPKVAPYFEIKLAVLPVRQWTLLKARRYRLRLPHLDLVKRDTMSVRPCGCELQSPSDFRLPLMQNV